MREREDAAEERRRAGPVDVIDEAVVLASIDGVGPALDYMSNSGVPHNTALRVLADPRYHRRPSSVSFEKVLGVLSSRVHRNKESKSGR